MRETTTQLTTLSYTVTITEALLAGQTLQATQGCTVRINNLLPALPYLLKVGDVLAVTHTAGDNVLSGLSLLAAAGAETPAGGIPEVDPATWSWTDSFSRSFLGAEYETATSALPAINISAGGLVLGHRVTLVLTNGQSESQREYARARLLASHWNSPDVQVQYDAKFSVVQGGSAPFLPLIGVRLVGAQKTLDWDGYALFWGGVQIASGGAAMLADVTYRFRLTVDQAAGRIQISRDQDGLIDVALPADWDAGMGGQGLVELFHQTSRNTTNGIGGGVYTAATFDNLAVRSGDGTAQTGGGSAGSGAVRLGSQWRFAEGPPDDTLGADGDVWAQTTTGAVFQRVNGAYQAAANLRGPEGPAGAPAPATAAVAARSARLGVSAAPPTPGTYPQQGQGTRTVSDGIYPVTFRFDFTTAYPFGLEGFDFYAAALSGGTLQSAYIQSQLGTGPDLGEATFTTSPDQALATCRWSNGHNLAPGMYSLVLSFSPGTSLVFQRGQNFYGGATALVFASTSNSTDIPVGAYLGFSQSKQAAVGVLDPFAMRVSQSPSAVDFDPAAWGQNAFEIVAVPGQTPYLHFRHDGLDWQLPLTLVPPAGGGGGGEAT